MNDAATVRKLRAQSMSAQGNLRGKISPGRRLPRKLLANFTRDLAIMLSARMQLVDSLDILARQSANERFREVLQQLLTGLRSGRSFADCLRSRPAIFSNFYVNLVEVGEMTGKLDEMLARLNVYLDKMAELRRKLVQALTYPALIVTVAVLALGFIMLYVIPTFADIFQDFDAELPLPTLVVMGLSDIVQQYFLYAICGFAAALALIKYSRSLRRVQIWGDNLMLGIPLLGELIRKNYISQFCRTLGTLLESGVSLLQSLEIASKSTQNYHIQQDIAKMQRFATRGGQLTESLKESKIFPLMVTQMIAVGEETAELPFMLLKIADFYDREIDSAIELLSSIIEPLVIVFLGIVIGAILISIYLPLFNMSTIIG